jgi:hypothetical protein
MGVVSFIDGGNWSKLRNEKTAAKIQLPKLVSRVTRLLSVVEQELLTLPEHMSSHSVCSGVRVSQSLFLCVMVFFIIVTVFSSIYGFGFGIFKLFIHDPPLELVTTRLKLNENYSFLLSIYVLRSTMMLEYLHNLFRYIDWCWEVFMNRVDK